MSRHVVLGIHPKFLQEQEMLSKYRARSLALWFILVLTTVSVVEASSVASDDTFPAVGNSRKPECTSHVFIGGDPVKS